MRWLAIGLILLTACDRRPVAPPPLVPYASPAVTASVPDRHVREVSRSSVLAVGDIMMHGMVLRAADQHDRRGDDGESLNHAGFDDLFAPVASLIQGADLAFGNLETPVAPERGVSMPRYSDNAPVFNAPTALLEALHSTGFDVVSLANNHSYDQERVGLEETIEHLDASPLVAIGVGETCAQAYAPRVVAAGDILVGWIGAAGLYNYNLNGADDEVCVASLDEERLLVEVAKARAEGAEIVVVSVHSGVEYATAPEPAMAEVARRLIDGGVDVILGHHPHVLQPVELHAAPDGRVGLIAFSLGNFISNQSAWFKPGLHRPQNGNPRDGLALQFDVVRKDYGGGIFRTELANVVAVPLWTENNTYQRRGSELVTIRTHVASDLLDAAGSRMTAARADGDAETVVSAGRELEWRTERRELVAEIIGPGLLR